MKCVVCGRLRLVVETVEPSNGLPAKVAICPGCVAAIRRREVGIVRRDNGALYITDGREHGEKRYRKTRANRLAEGGVTARAGLNQKRRYRVWLDGCEVTDRCFYFDARRGIVRLFKHDASGRPYLDGDEVAKEERRGRVRTQAGAKRGVAQAVCGKRSKRLLAKRGMDILGPLDVTVSCARSNDARDAYVALTDAITKGRT